MTVFFTVRQGASAGAVLRDGKENRASSRAGCDPPHPQHTAWCLCPRALMLPHVPLLPACAQEFTVHVLDPLRGCVVGTGQGNSKKEAGERAAREGLRHYGLRL